MQPVNPCWVSIISWSAFKTKCAASSERILLTIHIASSLKYLQTANLLTVWKLIIRQLIELSSTGRINSIYLPVISNNSCLRRTKQNMIDQFFLQLFEDPRLFLSFIMPHSHKHDFFQGTTAAIMVTEWIIQRRVKHQQLFFSNLHCNMHIRFLRLPYALQLFLPYFIQTGKPVGFCINFGVQK